MDTSWCGCNSLGSDVSVDLLMYNISKYISIISIILIINNKSYKALYSNQS